MAGEAEKALGAAAKMLFDTARSLDSFVEQMDALFQKQEHVLDKIAEKIAHAGKGGPGGDKKGVAGALKGFAGDFKSLAGSLSDLAEAGPKLKAGFQALTNGLKALNTALKIYSTVPKESVNQLTTFLDDLSKRFEEIKIERIQKGADAVKSMATAIVELGLSLLASTLLYTVAAIGSVIIIPMIAGYSFLFYEMGKAGKEIKEGATSLQEMGLGLLLFGLGLYAVKELAGGKWEDFAEGSLIVLVGMAVFGFAFELLGKLAPDVKKGAEALMFAGLGIASLAIGIWSFQLLNIGFGAVLVAGLAVAVVGLALGLAGAFSEEMDSGATALILSGVALASLALGIWMFKALKIGMSDVLITGFAVLTIGVLFGLAGMVAEFIGLGVLAFVGVSIALILLAYGLKKFKDAKIEAEDLEIVGGSVIALGAAFALAGVGALFIGIGAISMLAAGAALIGIAKGLKDFRDIKYTDADAEMIKTVVGSLAAAFAQAGDPGQNKLFGFSIGPNKVEKGIDSVMHAGDALTNIAKGILAFGKLKISPKDNPEIYENIKNTVGAVSEAFAAIGNKGAVESTSFFKGLFGIKDNPVQQGIDSVRGVGKELSDIAAGVLAFSNMTFKDPVSGKVVKLTDAMLQDALANIASTLTTVSNVFGAIGGAGNQVTTTGFWKSLTGAKDNAVAQGIDAVRGVGKELVDLAQGVQEFASLKFKDPVTGKEVQLTQDMIQNQVGPNIAMVLTIISDQFAAIGGKQTTSSNFFKKLVGAKDNAVQKGIEAIHGVGAEFKGIADGLQAFSKVDNLQQTETNISAILSLVPTTILDVYNKTLKGINMFMVTDAYGKLQSILTPMVDMLVQVKDKNLSVKEADVLSQSVQALLKGVTGMKVSIDVTALKSVVEYVERLAATTDPMMKLASSFEKIAKNMDKFATSFKKMDKEALKNSDMLIQSMTVLAKVDPAAFDTLVSKGKNLIDYIFSKTGAEAETKATPGYTTPITPEVTEPGRKPVPPAPIEKTKGPTAAELQMQQVMSDLSDKMAAMSTDLKGIHDTLLGTLKVTEINR